MVHLHPLSTWSPNSKPIYFFTTFVCLIKTVVRPFTTCLHTLEKGRLDRSKNLRVPAQLTPSTLAGLGLSLDPARNCRVLSFRSECLTSVTRFAHDSFFTFFMSTKPSTYTKVEFLCNRYVGVKVKRFAPSRRAFRASTHPTDTPRNIGRFSHDRIFTGFFQNAVLKPTKKLLYSLYLFLSRFSYG